MLISSTSPPFGSTANDNGVWQRLINEIPPHDTFVALCMGKSKVLEKIRPATHTLGVDTSAFILDLIQQTVTDRSIELHKDSCIRFLKSYRWNPDSRYVIFIDPPSLAQPSDFPHMELLGLLASLQGQFPNLYFLVYHPDNPIYNEVLSGWRKVTFSQRMGTHAIYASQPIVKGRLHDYRYVGNNWQDRDALKKAVTRWVNTFTGMVEAEREAMLRVVYTFDWPQERNLSPSDEGILCNLVKYEPSFRLAILEEVGKRLCAKGMLPKGVLLPSISVTQNHPTHAN